MGKAANRKLHRKDKIEGAKLDEAIAAGREVPYTALLRTGRAVRYHNRDGVWWVEVQLAGFQGADASPDAKRSFWVAFTDERSAKRTGGSLLDRLREWEYAGRINTDPRYNKIIEAWAQQVKKKIEEMNADALRRAERQIQHARVPTLAELFGLSAKKKDVKGD